MISENFEKSYFMAMHCSEELCPGEPAENPESLELVEPRSLCDVGTLQGTLDDLRIMTLVEPGLDLGIVTDPFLAIELVFTFWDSLGGKFSFDKYLAQFGSASNSGGGGGRSKSPGLVRPSSRASCNSLSLRLIGSISSWLCSSLERTCLVFSYTTELTGSREEKIWWGFTVANKSADLFMTSPSKGDTLQ